MNFNLFTNLPQPLSAAGCTGVDDRGKGRTMVKPPFSISFSNPPCLFSLADPARTTQTVSPPCYPRVVLASVLSSSRRRLPSLACVVLLHLLRQEGRAWFFWGWIAGRERGMSQNLEQGHVSPIRTRFHHPFFSPSVLSRLSLLTTHFVSPDSLFATHSGFSNEFPVKFGGTRGDVAPNDHQSKVI